MGFSPGSSHIVAVCDLLIVLLLQALGLHAIAIAFAIGVALVWLSTLIAVVVRHRRH